MSNGNFIKRHPLMIYFALKFAISWGGLLILIGPSGIPRIIDQTHLGMEPIGPIRKI